MEYDLFYTLFITINITITIIMMLAACLCCRKKIPKNEFLGLEGMVKIKNPEDSVTNTESSVQIDLNTSTAGETDSKRASNAPHRSLPDIPVNESLNDNGSELYATVADKVHEKPQGRSPTPSLKKQTSVSQHSSISQADDVSSPYARVKTPPHDYDKVLPTEHPYAQLNTPGPSTAVYAPNSTNPGTSVTSRRGSNQSLLRTSENQLEIPAASAIAGMVSASQELPYMTPPIIQQQPHFSGDSQDSSKGYTSISVREPLANILAQTIHPVTRTRPKDSNDSHYATVSDDSDEMYAAIDDRNNQVDLYTSGSETYAQIQPSNAITVSVEINTSRIPDNPEPNRLNVVAVKKHTNETPIPPPVDSLKAQMHSRQASSSSNTSSIANLGSPKPEKRQANSPLPPTPKNLQYLSNSNLTSSSSIPSGRNSVASVIECQIPLAHGSRLLSKENLQSSELEDETGNKKNFSPSRDIEGMYAKVMKKNKFSNVPSQNSSPILSRKAVDETNSSEPISTDLNIKEFVLNAIQTSPGKSSIKSAKYIDNNYETIDKRRPRSSSFTNKDHGYETIPADKTNGNNNLMISKRKSDGYAQIAQKEMKQNEAGIPVLNLDLSIQHSLKLFKEVNTITKPPSEPGYESLPDNSIIINDPGYETLSKTGKENDEKKPISDYDPNYEVLRPTKLINTDDGYAKVWEKFPQPQDEDTVDGYSRVKDKDNLIPAYIRIPPEAKQTLLHNKTNLINNNNNSNNNNNNNEETGSDIYSSIPNEQNLPYSEELEYHNYQTISETKYTTLPTPNNSACSNLSDKLTTPSTGQNSPDSRQMKYSSTSNTISSQQHSSNYESLTGSESDPNYESVRRLETENPYERLNDTNISPDIVSGNKLPQGKGLQQNSDTKLSINNENGEVDDYFQV